MKKLLNWLVKAVVLLLKDSAIGVDRKSQTALLAELDDLKQKEPTLFDEP